MKLKLKKDYLLWYNDSSRWGVYFSPTTWGLPLHIWWDEWHFHLGVLCFFFMHWTKKWQEDTDNEYT